MKRGGGGGGEGREGKEEEGLFILVNIWTFHR
jgi:hypothetical protein